MQPDSIRRRRYEALVEQVHDPLIRYLMRRMPSHDAEDVMSDVLMILWRRLDVVPETAPLPWCYGVARRAMANHRRGTRRRLALVGRLEAERRPTNDASGSPDHVELADALDALDGAERELITLWAWEGLEPREIAQVLEITPNAASIRLTRAKAKIARHLRKNRPPVGHGMDEDTGERS